MFFSSMGLRLIDIFAVKTAVQCIRIYAYPILRNILDLHQKLISPAAQTIQVVHLSPKGRD
jgi:hypothetical protein